MDKGSYRTINVPNALSTIPFGINAGGTIVGAYIDSSGRKHGFSYASGAFKTLDAPNSRQTSAYGINSLGVIVGVFADSDGQAHGFQYDGLGVYTTVDAPGPAGVRGSSAISINDLGQIAVVGTSAFLATLTP